MMNPAGVFLGFVTALTALHAAPLSAGFLISGTLVFGGAAALTWATSRANRSPDRSQSVC